MNTQVHRHTPTLNAMDSVGQDMRKVAYHRRHAADELQPRIARQVLSPAGHVLAAWDARLSAKGARPNQACTYSLSGLLLSSDSADAGQRICRYTAAGAIRECWDSRGTRRMTHYDAVLRPVMIETAIRGARHNTVTDRFTYADASGHHALRNQCGRLIRQDDEAGSLLTSEYALTGPGLHTTRRFLMAIGTPNWPSSPAQRDRLLEMGDGATTRQRYSPLGDLLEHLDAAGHRQRKHYTLTGQLARLTFCPQGAREQTIVQALHYNASDQLQSLIAGNGIVSDHEHDAANGALLRRRVTHSRGAVLQDLAYAYDPAGNLLRTEDATQKVRHFSNQRVDGICHFTFDSLYQLIEATGREAAGARVQSSLPPADLQPGHTDRLVNYTQHYHYDEGGNLTRLRHVGHQSYTRDLDVAPDSNRGLPRLAHQDARPLDSGFDENGNLLVLENGHTLQWNALNQLQRVTVITRPSGEDDTEYYAYDGSGYRARKVRLAKAYNVTTRAETRYLPGLEVHTQGSQSWESVTLHGGQITVRYRRGDNAKAGAATLCYGLNDHLGSCSLEVDESGELLSHEGYYPYGGTAWWAAASEAQARHKVIRYSGKERDASGLYAYGLRYYAPWLQRWISPDPAGTVDGLNLYRMVANAPVNAVDDDGLMLRNVAKFAGGAAYAGYKLAKKDEQPAAPPRPTPTSRVTPGEAKANEWLDQSRQHVVAPEEKVKGAFSGRLAAAYNLAHGKLPGKDALVKGVEVTAEAAQLAAHGDVAQLDKTRLAKSVVVDGYNNLGNPLVAAKKAVHTTAVAATLPVSKQGEVQEELQRRGQQTVDGLKVSASVGVAVAGALDTAAGIAPPGPVKLGLIGASAAWKTLGVIHTAEQVANAADEHKNLVSNEFGKELNAQIVDINKQKRQELIGQFAKRVA